MKNLPELQELLRDSACRLTRGKNIPISLADICTELGVTVRRSHAQRKAALLDASENPQIVLPGLETSTDRYTAGERFLVAHELGHLILHRNGVPKPLGRSEYWQHEDLCDRFARWLLLPFHSVDVRIRSGRNTPSQRLNLSAYMERVGQVPWPVAAYAVADQDSAVSFFRVVKCKDGRFMVDLSTLARRKERGRLFDVKDPLGATIIALKIGQGPAEFGLKESSTIQILRGARVAAMRVSSFETRLAACKALAG